MSEADRAARFAAYNQHCMGLIAEHGFMIQGVFPVESTPPKDQYHFYYTVGLLTRGRAELVLCGMGRYPEIASAWLNVVAGRMLAEERDPTPGEEWDIEEPDDATLARVTARFGLVTRRWADRNARRSAQYWPELAKQHRVIQVLWPSCPDPEQPPGEGNELFWPTREKPWNDQPLLAYRGD